MTNWHAPIRWYIEGGFITFVFVLATIGCTLRIENGKVLPGLMFQETTGKTQIAVVLTLLALGIRCLWMFIRATSTDDNFWLYALDRLIIPLAYMGFNVVVVEMACVWATSIGSDPESVRRTAWVSTMLIWVVCLTYTVIAAVDKDLVVGGVQCDQDAGKMPSYQCILGKLDVILLCAVFVVLAGRFSLSARQFSRSLRVNTSHGRGSLNPVVLHTIKRVELLSLVCTLVFGLRFLLWAWGALVFDFKVLQLQGFSLWLENALYPTCYYTLPEVVASVALLLVLAPYQRPDDSERSETTAIRSRTLVDSPLSFGSQRTGGTGNGGYKSRDRYLSDAEVMCESPLLRVSSHYNQYNPPTLTSESSQHSGGGRFENQSYSNPSSSRSPRAPARQNARGDDLVSQLHTHDHYQHSSLVPQDDSYVNSSSVSTENNIHTSHLIDDQVTYYDNHRQALGNTTTIGLGMGTKKSNKAKKVSKQTHREYTSLWDLNNS